VEDSDEEESDLDEAPESEDEDAKVE